MSLLLCWFVAARVDAQSLPIAAPASATSLDGTQNDLYSSADVDLDGVPLFRVATPASVNGQPAAVKRALLVASALQQLVATDARGTPLYDPATFHVWAHRDGDEITIDANDARHPTALTIVTVTSTDAKYQQTTTDDVAASWQSILQGALVDALRKREPSVERLHGRQIAQVAFAIAIGTVLLLFASKSLRHRISSLTDELAEGEVLTAAGPGADLHKTLRRSATLHRLRMLSAAAGALSWLIVLSWFIAATWALGLFSQTTAFGRALSHGASAIGIIGIGTVLANHFFDFAIARAASTWKTRQYLTSEEQTRILLRVPTAAGAISHFKTFALAMLAVLLSLGQLGLPVGSVVTIGSVAALAVTFGAQNILKDVAAGITVLYEDQYAVGDFVSINGHIGIVEELTLRMVMIRDLAGSVVTISHGSVTGVSNYSRIWSRIDYQISIGPEADPEAAVDAVRTSIEELAKAPESKGALLLPIEWIGVDAFSKEWTLIRASIRTAPLQQFALRREINGRVRRRLAESGIGYGPPIETQYIPIF